MEYIEKIDLGYDSTSEFEKKNHAIEYKYFQGQRSKIGYHRLKLMFPDGFNKRSWFDDYVLSYDDIVGRYTMWTETGTNTSLQLQKLVGTSHNQYAALAEKESLTWIEWLGSLKKFYSNWYLMSRGVESISSIVGGSLVTGFNGKFFVTGNGNNRLVILKFLDVQEIHLDNISIYKD